MKYNKIKAIAFAKLLKICPEWREFKSKWDGKIPRKNSKRYSEYVKDGNSLQTTLDKLVGRA